MPRVDSKTYVYHGGIPNEGEGQGITDIIVAEGVEAIEDRSFFQWLDLKSVMIQFPRNTALKRIGDQAFHECLYLADIQIPETVTQIGDGAFNFCALSLSTIKIPSSMTTIPQNCFFNCQKLSKIDIPSSVRRIGSDAFSSCTNLTSIRLPNDIHDIGENAFFGCPKLQSIQIPPSTAIIHDNTFSDCSSIRIMYVPSSLIDTMQNSIELFINRPNSILLTDDEGLIEPPYPTLTVQKVQQCIDSLQFNIPQTEQMNALHEILDEHYPIIAKKAQQSSFTLLHLLAYFPGNIHYPISQLLHKCPQATLAVDDTRKTPLHHAITSTKHNMDARSYDLLLKNTPNIVVHHAIRSRSPLSEIYDIVNAKIGGLKVEDEESRLLPFMAAAEYDTLDLSAVYQLLSMQPDVMNEYVILKDDVQAKENAVNDCSDKNSDADDDSDDRKMKRRRV